MSKNPTRFEEIQEKTKTAILETNVKINDLGIHAESLFERLDYIQILFDKIRNVPNEEKERTEELKKVRLEWKQQVEVIEKKYNEAAVKDAAA